MYQSVRRPTRDEICPAALNPQKSILSMPVLTDNPALLLAPPWYGAGCRDPGPPHTEGTYTAAKTPAAGNCDCDGLWTPPWL